MDERTWLTAFLLKWWSWACYVIIGILAKFSYDLVQGRKISLMQAIGTTGISVFIGFLTSVWCMSHNAENGALIVPIATLLADKLVTSILTLDWGSLFDTIYNWTKKK